MTRAISNTKHSNDCKCKSNIEINESIAYTVKKYIHGNEKKIVFFFSSLFIYHYSNAKWLVTTLLFIFWICKKNKQAWINLIWFSITSFGRFFLSKKVIIKRNFGWPHEGTGTFQTAKKEETMKNVCMSYFSATHYKVHFGTVRIFFNENHY